MRRGRGQNGPGAVAYIAPGRPPVPAHLRRNHHLFSNTLVHAECGDAACITTHGAQHQHAGLSAAHADQLWPTWAKLLPSIGLDNDAMMMTTFT